MSAAITAAVIGIAGTAWAANEAGDAAQDAAGVQRGAADASTAEFRRQFDYVQQLMQPYVQAGNAALTQQQALAGLLGPEQQRAAMQGIEQDPMFQARVQQGENALLQNASATGGLRGGNTQAALAQFRPSMLGQAIQERMAALAGLSANGQNAAAGLGGQAMGMAGQIGNNMTQAGAAQAGAYIAQGQAQQQLIGGVSGALGAFAAQRYAPQPQVAAPMPVQPTPGSTAYWNQPAPVGAPI